VRALGRASRYLTQIALLLRRTILGTSSSLSIDCWEDRSGNLCGTLVFRSVIIKKLAADDLVVTFDGTNKLGKGAINTQGVIRSADMFTANGVTFAIVGGYCTYKKARGTVTAKVVNSILALDVPGELSDAGPSWPVLSPAI
jgi:hypothetical protein